MGLYYVLFTQSLDIRYYGPYNTSFSSDRAGRLVACILAVDRSLLHQMYRIGAITSCKYFVLTYLISGRHRSFVYSYSSVILQDSQSNIPNTFTISPLAGKGEKEYCIRRKTGFPKTRYVPLLQVGVCMYKLSDTPNHGKPMDFPSTTPHPQTTVIQGRSGSRKPWKRSEIPTVNSWTIRCPRQHDRKALRGPAV